jgi:hypothetical protein
MTGCRSRTLREFRNTGALKDDQSPKTDRVLSGRSEEFVRKEVQNRSAVPALRAALETRRRTARYRADIGARAQSASVFPLRGQPVARCVAPRRPAVI